LLLEMKKGRTDSGPEKQLGKFGRLN